ncbi:MAG TPA: hypothetical protein VGJ84_12350 [Polyangiaceae bacterium]|jgi:hypothetical protein
MTRSSSDVRLWRLLFACFVPVLAGCGHPASVSECEQIVERIAMLEYQRRYPDTSPQILKEKADVEKELQHDPMMKQCVGKRITDKMMRCVRNAKTAKEIVSGCFN